MVYHPFNPLSHYNHLGYYQIGNHLTYSKIEAMDLAARTGDPAWFRFNDKQFVDFDWTTEPQQSLDSLYQLRARQIRDRYDYVVLMYSGGADSHNVLMSFLNAGTHIDEIVHVVEYEGDGDKESFANAEIFKVAYPTVQNLIIQRNLKTKQRVIDVSKIILDLGDLLDAEEYRSGTSSWMTPGNMAKSYIREQVKDYLDLADQGKKICFVWGVDKPSLVTMVHKTNFSIEHAVVFHDREGSLISPRQKYLSRIWEHDEYFYWSPDLPELLSKQAHLLRRLFNQSTMQTQVDLKFKEFGFAVKNNKVMILNLNDGHRVIYPYWDTTTFSSGKTMNRVFGDRDAWLFKDVYSTKTGRMFCSVVDSVRSNPFWTNDISGFPVTYGRIYPLAQINNVQDYEIHYPLDKNPFASMDYF